MGLVFGQKAQEQKVATVDFWTNEFCLLAIRWLIKSEVTRTLDPGRVGASRGRQDIDIHRGASGY